MTPLRYLQRLWGVEPKPPKSPLALDAGETRDGLTKASTWRERRHYRRHGVWPASYLLRLLADSDELTAADREAAKAVVEVGKRLNSDVRRGRWG